VRNGRQQPVPPTAQQALIRRFRPREPVPAMVSAVKHASWLNQVELWLSILVRKLLRRGNFTSTDDVRTKVLDFIAYFNRTLAKPFKWTYLGKPLHA
jgi:hypothetical protein